MSHHLYLFPLKLKIQSYLHSPSLHPFHHIRSTSINSKFSPITNNFFYSMAALTIGHLSLFGHKPDLIPRKNSRRLLILSCQNSDPTDPFNAKKRNTEKIEEKGIFELSFSGIKKFGEGLRDNMSPKQKGDWKDITLMSLSFAVYVYMSQKIVCAYCVWMSMLRQPW